MPSPSRRPARWRRWLVYISFLATSAVALWVPLYNRTEPSLGGVPFFYWFQMVWIAVAVLATAVAYRLGV